METVDEDIRVDRPAPAIVRITLAREKQMNAYSMRMCRELLGAFREFDRDDGARVLVITGAGRGFCAGGDVSGSDSEHDEYMRLQLSHGREMRDGMQRVILELTRLDKPTIAMINGPAVAGGLALALACDLRIAATSAKLGDTSGKFGLLPDEGGAWLFPRAMGLDRALKMTWLAEVYDAETARRLGLVTEIVPDAELSAHTLALATALAARAPLAVRLAKAMMRRSVDLTLEQSQGDAALSVMISNPSQDVTEGVLAFREKRAPKFDGR
ncbi:MAG TPA: enoyl-CoA hydratase/isomerase family protein [Polyangiales bacterium]|nr:enoyl-CoA hydratase/isomerase family protein [Polyangiales bacterium]